MWASAVPRMFRSSRSTLVGISYTLCIGSQKRDLALDKIS